MRSMQRSNGPPLLFVRRDVGSVGRPFGPERTYDLPVLVFSFFLSYPPTLSSKASVSCISHQVEADTERG
jgi:hypothetical protein